MLKALQQECGATGLASELCVVEERLHTLVEEVRLHGAICGREAGWHERITLLATLCLQHAGKVAAANSDGES